MKRLSIGLRLTFFYLLIFAVAQLVFGAGMWFLLRHALYQIADHSLTDRMEDVQRFLQAQKKNATDAKFEEELAETYVIEHSGDYMQVFTAEGKCLFRSRSLHEHDLATTAQSGEDRTFGNLTLGGVPFRTVSQVSSAQERKFLVQLAQPMSEAQRTLDLFREDLLMFAPIILLLAAAVGYRTSRSALAPVDAITTTARAINGYDLSQRLPKLETADELQRLSETLNDMLSRIEGAFSRVRQFTADASHELRTPISLIRTEAELALRRSRGEKQYREALHQILGESIRTSALIEELLTLARADSGRETLKMRRLELGALCNERAREWRLIAADQRLDFAVRIQKHDVFVMADSLALQRVVNILLENACRYTPAPGRIELELDGNEETAVLHVRDTGIGIPETEREKIFERFYRADAARGRDRGGAGLGLSIARWILQQHSGSVRVQDAAVQGSDFVVEIPLARNSGCLVT